MSERDLTIKDRLEIVGGTGDWGILPMHLSH